MKMMQTHKALYEVLKYAVGNGDIYIMALTPAQVNTLRTLVTVENNAIVLNPARFTEQTLGSSNTFAMRIEIPDQNTISLTSDPATLSITRTGKATHVLVNRRFPMLLEVGSDVKFVPELTEGDTLVLPAIDITFPNLV